jgi:endo-1,4-beta-xylanase
MLAVAPLAALALVLVGSPAQAAAGFVGEIMNDGNLKCLDVRTQDNYTVQLWDCHNRTEQQWIYGKFNVIEGVSYIQITNWRTGKCLEPAGGAVEAQVSVVVDQCVDTDSQLWAVHNPGPAAAYLVNKHSGLCLDLRNNDSANGTIIWQYWCNFTNAQWWDAQFGGW